MKSLSIGNSFSQDALRYVHAIAAADQREIDTANLYIGGCSLERHFQNLSSAELCYDYQINGEESGRPMALNTALEQGDWDIITLQQVSGLSGIADSYFPYITALLERVRETNPRARIALHQTWAYEWGFGSPDFVRYHDDQMEMYKAILSTYAYIAEQTGVSLVIPSGQVIQALRKNPLFNVKEGGNSLCRDGGHLDLIYGRYAASACWYETLFNGDILHNSFCPPCEEPADVIADKCDIIRRTVHEICGKI